MWPWRPERILTGDGPRFSTCRNFQDHAKFTALLYGAVNKTTKKLKCTRESHELLKLYAQPVSPRISPYQITHAAEIFVFLHDELSKPDVPTIIISVVLRVNPYTQVAHALISCNKPSHKRQDGPIEKAKTLSLFCSVLWIQ